MGTSSEDVLLVMNHVRHKKNDGALYIMASRVAWMPDGKEVSGSSRISPHLRSISVDHGRWHLPMLSLIGVRAKLIHMKACRMRSDGRTHYRSSRFPTITLT